MLLMVGDNGTKAGLTNRDVPTLSGMGYSRVLERQVVWNITLNHSGAFSYFLNMRTSGNMLSFPIDHCSGTKYCMVFGV